MTVLHIHTLYINFTSIISSPNVNGEGVVSYWQVNGLIKNLRTHGQNTVVVRLLYKLAKLS